MAELTQGRIAQVIRYQFDRLANGWRVVTYPAIVTAIYEGTADSGLVGLHIFAPGGLDMEGVKPWPNAEPTDPFNDHYFWAWPGTWETKVRNDAAAKAAAKAAKEENDRLLAEAVAREAASGITQPTTPTEAVAPWWEQPTQGD